MRVLPCIRDPQMFWGMRFYFYYVNLFVLPFLLHDAVIFCLSSIKFKFLETKINACVVLGPLMFGANMRLMFNKSQPHIIMKTYQGFMLWHMIDQTKHTLSYLAPLLPSSVIFLLVSHVQPCIPCEGSLQSMPHNPCQRN